MTGAEREERKEESVWNEGIEVEVLWDDLWDMIFLAMIGQVEGGVK